MNLQEREQLERGLAAGWSHQANVERGKKVRERIDEHRKAVAKIRAEKESAG